MKRLFVLSSLLTMFLASTANALPNITTIDAKTLSCDLVNTYTEITTQDANVEKRHKLIVSVSSIANMEVYEKNRVAINMYYHDLQSDTWIYHDVFIFSKPSDAHVFSAPEGADKLELRARLMDTSSTNATIAIHYLEEIE